MLGLNSELSLNRFIQTVLLLLNIKSLYKLTTQWNTKMKLQSIQQIYAIISP